MVTEQITNPRAPHQAHVWSMVNAENACAVTPRGALTDTANDIPHFGVAPVLPVSFPTRPFSRFPTCLWIRPRRIVRPTKIHNANSPIGAPYLWRTREANPLALAAHRASRQQSHSVRSPNSQRPWKGTLRLRIPHSALRPHRVGRSPLHRLLVRPLP